jgi:hypothetical protein
MLVLRAALTKLSFHIILDLPVVFFHPSSGKRTVSPGGFDYAARKLNGFSACSIAL